ncbi:hypothetical protein FOA52_016293 [Chlamydomonas sp. UWO 241]|nr:hypothetical protein FOA52_016293 [Chlamydomonas sp. UWO 241]
MRGMRREWTEELAASMRSCQALNTELRQLNDSGSLEILKATAAAKYKDMLSGLPSVIIVEEAGEVLEAHVLTSMSPETKQLIMFGDHEQLRPKVESWSLQMQSGQGLDLNVSMFERLIEDGFPHAALCVQHRMHPDISRLVRPTYPRGLEDHASMHNHPPLRGVDPGRRVIFVDHKNMEEQGGFRSSATMLSKVNKFEVGMAVATVKYLLQQGYAPGELVVLTPYLTAPGAAPCDASGDSGGRAE